MAEQNPTVCGTMSMKAAVPCEVGLSGAWQSCGQQGQDQPASGWSRGLGNIAEEGDKLHMRAQERVFFSTREHLLGNSLGKS